MSERAKTKEEVLSGRTISLFVICMLVFIACMLINHVDLAIAFFLFVIILQNEWTRDNK